MSNFIVVDIQPDGRVEGLHFDDFDLGFLGRKEVTRASEIVHNSETQLWDVVLPGATEPHMAAAGFDSYNKAREFEVLWLQHCRMAEADPYSEDGAVIASIARTAIELSYYKQSKESVNG
jgi:hypothetical protein